MTTELGSLFGLKKSVLLNKPDDRLVLPTKCIGIEVEVEGVVGLSADDRNPDGLDHWAMHADHSLHDRGMEFSFKEPMYGKDIRIALEQLIRFAVEHKWKTSKRTAIHIHLDVRDLPQRQLAGILIYYAMFEPVLYRWVNSLSNQNREESNFCVPWYKSDGAVDNIRRLVSLVYFAQPDSKVVNREMLRRSFDQFDKYAGLNIRPIQNFGSIEFRHLPTLFDIDIIEKWINLIFCLNRAAISAPASNIALVKETNMRGVRATFAEVFGSYGEGLYYDDLAKDVEEIGLPVAMELASALAEESSFNNFSCKEGEFEGVTKWLSKLGAQKVPKRKKTPKVVRHRLDEFIPIPSPDFSEAVTLASISGEWEEVLSRALRDSGPQTTEPVPLPETEEDFDSFYEEEDDNQP